MRKKIFFLINIIIVVGFFCFLNPHIVLAQKVSIKISPVRIEESVEPGQLLNLQVKLTNKSSVANTFYPYLRDFKSEDESGRATLIVPGTEDGYYLANWIDIDTKGTFLEPEEQKTINFQIKVPPETGPGGYYGAILFGTQPPRLQLASEDKGAGMAIAQQAASLILLKVRGDIDERAVIREFNTDKDFYSTPFKVNFTIRIENTGNVHIKPQGAIIIKNIFGKEVEKIRVNNNGGNVLPQSIRRFSDIIWEGNFGFGRYTATLGLSYGTPTSEGGQGKSSLVAAKSFWLIPWRIIIPLLLGLIIIGAIAILLLRVYRNKAIKKAMEEAGLGHVKYVKKFEGPSPTLHLGVVILISLIIVFIITLVIYFIFMA